MFIDGPLYSNSDCDGGVGFPSVVLYVVDKWVVLGVFVCYGLLWEYVMAVSEFDELYCVVCGG